MKIALSELQRSPCFHPILAAGKLCGSGNCVEIDDESAAKIFNDCRKINGFGDMVAFVAKPIAKVIDRLAGTKLETCGACGKRQQKLNELLPMKMNKR